MATRERLPNRRASQQLTFDCGPHPFIATISYFPGTNRLAEIFLGNGRADSDVDTAAKDSAVVCSIAFQYGVPLDVVRKSLMRDSAGRPSSPLGVVLDLNAGDQP
jgi:hypothetical protein